MAGQSVSLVKKIQSVKEIIVKLLNKLKNNLDLKAKDFLDENRIN